MIGLIQWLDGLKNYDRDLVAIKAEPNRKRYEKKLKKFKKRFTDYLSDYPSGEDGCLNEKAILFFINEDDGKIAKDALFNRVLSTIAPEQKDIDALKHPELSGHGPLVDSVVDTRCSSFQKILY